LDSQKLVNSANKDSVIYIAKEKIIQFLKQNLKGGEVVIVMGAGNRYEDVSLKLRTKNNEFFCPNCKEKIGFVITHTNKRHAIKLIRGKIKKKRY